MKPQNYRNHSRLLRSYHFFTFLPLLATVVGAFINLCHSSGDNLYSASLICMLSLILVSIFFHARIFALKAQDRAIRAEENFRHYLLTQKALDSRLKMSQIVALRFASNEEFVLLAERAANENLSNKQIKQAIKNWRGDFYRV